MLARTLLLIPAGILGFFLPGYFVSRILRSRAPFLCGFILSLLILFHSCFWLEIFAIPLTLLTVGSILSLITLAAFLFSRHYPFSGPNASSEPWTRSQWSFVALLALLVSVMLFKSIMTPLTGPDTLIRWDLLARRIYALHHFRFYPPVAADDFRNYFFPDAIPPMVSFSYWWTYVAAGGHFLRFTAFFITAQYLATLLFTYRITKTLSNPQTALVSVAILASTFLFFYSVAIGQDTGLTALSTAASIYFIVSAVDRDDWRAAFLAGASAALGALSREYALAITLIAILTALWRGMSFRAISILLLTSIVLTAPWYIRTWIKTGNPLYSYDIAHLFPVNPVWVAANRFYATRLGFTSFTSAKWLQLVQWLLSTMPVQLLLSIPALLAVARRHWFLPAAAFIAIAIWATSVKFTAGALLSTRVLTPALVITSIAIALWLNQLRISRFVRELGALVLVLILLWTALRALVYPSPLDAAAMTNWKQSIFNTQLQLPDFDQLATIASKALRPGVRILSAQAHVHAASIGTSNEVVSMFSPEAEFVFDRSLDESVIYNRLREHNIGAIWFVTSDLNQDFFMSYPFFANGLPRWKILDRHGPNFLLEFSEK